MKWFKKKEASGDGKGVTQTLADQLGYWFLILGIGLGGVAVGAAYYGLLVVASTFGSIVFVALTVYAFLKYWSEDEPLKPSSPAPKTEQQQPARRVSVPVVGVNDAPKTRFLFAIREIARRQDDYKISQQGAERFAKVIRYMLRHQQGG